jgi:hypothetical protein
MKINGNKVNGLDFRVKDYITGQRFGGRVGIAGFGIPAETLIELEHVWQLEELIDVLSDMLQLIEKERLKTKNKYISE